MESEIIALLESLPHVTDVAVTRPNVVSVDIQCPREFVNEVHEKELELYQRWPDVEFEFNVWYPEDD